MKIPAFFTGDRARLRIVGTIIAALVLLGLLWHGLTDENPSSGSPETMATVPVRQGPLVISVIEAGTINPRQRTVIKSEVQGRNRILYLIPEGKTVEKGELLVELDASSLVDNRIEQEIKVRNMESQFIQARENLEVVKNQAVADVDKARLEVRFAIEDLKKYKDGEYPNQLKQLQSKITLAEEELERTRQKLEWSRKLFDEKYLSATELQADDLAFKKAALELELARSNLQLLEDYTYKRTLDQLTSDVNQAEMALERITRRTAADVIQAEVTFSARESEYERQNEKLAKLDEQIEKAKIRAPTAGTVVYATSAQFNWRGNVEPLDEGQEVQERQELIHLPVSDTFMAMVKVHESSLKKIELDMPVRLTVDALPGQTFTGQVSRIAPLPDPRSMFMNPDLKLYDTEIDIDGGAKMLRTGMTCEAEIIVESYDDAMYVPLQCVVRVNGKHTVYVLDERGNATPRTVEIGLDNNRMVHVLDGIEPGEDVLLTPPLTQPEHQPGKRDRMTE